MANFADTIARLKTGTYTVTRRTPAALVSGRAQAPTTSTLSIDAIVQPASGRQLQRLPDGMRAHEAITIWTTTELKIQTTSTLPDLISYRGASYEVQLVRAWDELGNYFEATAVKVGS